MSETIPYRPRYVVKSGNNFLDYTGGEPHEVHVVDAKRYKTLSGAEALAVWWLQMQATGRAPKAKVEIYTYSASEGSLKKTPPLTCTTCLGNSQIWDAAIGKYVDKRCVSCGN